MHSLSSPSRRNNEVRDKFWQRFPALRLSKAVVEDRVGQLLHGDGAQRSSGMRMRRRRQCSTAGRCKGGVGERKASASQ